MKSRRSEPKKARRKTTRKPRYFLPCTTTRLVDGDMGSPEVTGGSPSIWVTGREQVFLWKSPEDEDNEPTTARQRRRRRRSSPTAEVSKDTAADIITISDDSEEEETIPIPAKRRARKLFSSSSSEDEDNETTTARQRRRRRRSSPTAESRQPCHGGLKAIFHGRTAIPNTEVLDLLRSPERTTHCDKVNDSEENTGRGEAEVEDGEWRIWEYAFKLNQTGLSETKDTMNRKLRHVLIFLLIILKEPKMPEGLNPCVVVGINTNTAASVMASGDDQAGQGQSQAVTASTTNTTATVMASGDDHPYENIDNPRVKTGQGQSQANTASNTNTTATVMTSGHDQRGQGQSQVNIQTLNVGNLSHNEMLAALQPNPVYLDVKSPPKDASTEIANSNDQTGQGQSQAVTESLDVRNLSYGTGQTASQQNSVYKAVTQSQTITNTAAIVMTSSHDPTGQSQSQAITESLDARNLSYGTGPTDSKVVKIEQFTFRVWTAIWTSSGQFVLRPEPVSNIKPRRTAPLPHDRDPHGFTEKPIQSNRRKNLPVNPLTVRKLYSHAHGGVTTLRLGHCRLAERAPGAINLKEYRADFAFEESIQNMKLCANSGSHQALASTRFLHKTCSQGK
ncbi:Bax inhibitor 1 [Branchiostoma belcheri]|nr:Bax inhibitor 1 [Branchiostoma belcheri]